MTYYPQMNIGDVVHCAWRGPGGTDWEVTHDRYMRMVMAHGILSATAGYGGKITYKTLASLLYGDEAQQFMSDEAGFRQLTALMDILSLDYQRQGLPVITGLVVEAATGYPADGFILDPNDTFEELWEECWDHYEPLIKPYLQVP